MGCVTLAFSKMYFCSQSSGSSLVNLFIQFQINLQVCVYICVTLAAAAFEVLWVVGCTLELIGRFQCECGCL